MQLHRHRVTEVNQASASASLLIHHASVDCRFCTRTARSAQPETKLPAQVV